MIDPDDNPYPAGFGIVPPVLAGRDAEFSDLTAMLRRTAAGRYEEPRLLVGDRGYGKTVLLAELAAQARQPATVTPGTNLVVDVEAMAGRSLLARLVAVARERLLASSLNARLGAAARQVTQVLSAVGARYAGLEITADLSDQQPLSGDLVTDVTRLLEDLQATVRPTGGAVLIMIDEVQQADDTMGMLGAALQHLARQTADPRDSARVGLLMAGLPSARPRLRTIANTYLLDRIKEFELGPLSDSESVEALDVPARELGVTWTAQALQRATEHAAGYPYLLQLTGRSAWDQAAGTSTIDLAATQRGIAVAQQHMDRLYAARLDEVPPGERRYLHAAATIPTADRTSGTVATALGTTSDRVGTYRQRLIDRGLLREADGRLVFTVPGLSNFIARSPGRHQDWLQGPKRTQPKLPEPAPEGKTR